MKHYARKKKQTILLTESTYKLFRSRLANHLNPLISTLDTNTITGNPGRPRGLRQTRD